MILALYPIFYGLHFVARSIGVVPIETGGTALRILIWVDTVLFWSLGAILLVTLALWTLRGFLFNIKYVKILRFPQWLTRAKLQILKANCTSSRALRYPWKKFCRVMRSAPASNEQLSGVVSESSRPTDLDPDVTLLWNYTPPWRSGGESEGLPMVVYTESWVDPLGGEG